MYEGELHILNHLQKKRKRNESQGQRVAVKDFVKKVIFFSGGQHSFYFKDLYCYIYFYLEHS